MSNSKQLIAKPRTDTQGNTKKRKEMLLDTEIYSKELGILGGWINGTLVTESWVEAGKEDASKKVVNHEGVKKKRKLNTEKKEGEPAPVKTYSVNQKLHSKQEEFVPFRKFLFPGAMISMEEVDGDSSKMILQFEHALTLQGYKSFFINDLLKDHKWEDAVLSFDLDWV